MLPRNLDELIDLAKLNSGAKSDRELARKIGVAHLHHYRRRGVIPDDDTAMRLAELAGLPGPVVLALCHQWAAERDQQDAVAKAWAEIRDLLVKASAKLMILFALLSYSPTEGKSAISIAATQGPVAISSITESTLCDIRV